MRRMIRLGLAASLLLGTGLQLAPAHAASAAPPAVVVVTTRAPAAAPSDPSHETVRPASTSLKPNPIKGTPVRPQVTYDGSHVITTNIVLDNLPDYYAKVMWYWDTNECGSSGSWCWVPKWVEGGSNQFLSCALDRIDADYMVGAGGGTLVQRVGKAFANPSNPGSVDFTSGAWSFDVQDPRVNTKQTTDGGPGCTPANWQIHSTTRN
jgi:hypothetical protein